MFQLISSVIFWLLGAAVFFHLSGYFRHKKGKLENALTTTCIVLGLLFAGLSYYYFYWAFAGRPISAYWLNEEVIYQVNGQNTGTTDENIVNIENAKGKVWCVRNYQLPPETRFVRAIKFAEGWNLEPVDLKIPTPKAPQE